MPSQHKKPVDKQQSPPPVEPALEILPDLDPSAVPNWSARRQFSLLPALQSFMTLILVVAVAGLIVTSLRLSSEVQAKLAEPDERQKTEKVLNEVEQLLTGRIGDLNDQVKKLTQDLATTKSEKNAADNKVADLEKRLNSDDKVDLRNQLTKRVEESAKKDAEVKTLTENVNTLMAKATKFEAEVNKLKAEGTAFSQLKEYLPDKARLEALDKFLKEIESKDGQPSSISKKLAADLRTSTLSDLDKQLKSDEFLNYIVEPLNLALKKSNLKSEVDKITDRLQKSETERNSLWQAARSPKVKQTSVVVWDDIDFSSTCYERALQDFLKNPQNASLLLSPSLELRVWAGSVGAIQSEPIYSSAQLDRARILPKDAVLSTNPHPDPQPAAPGALAPADLKKLFPDRIGKTEYESRCVLVIPVKAGAPQDPAKLKGWEGIRVDVIAIGQGTNGLDNWKQWEDFCWQHGGTASLVLAQSTGDHPAGKQLQSLNQRSSDAILRRLELLIRP